MNKTFKNLAVAALTTGAFSGAAVAQSSMVLYGVVDMGVRNARNGTLGNTTSLSSGNNLTSRLGFRGTEDLGGGLSAGFVLEGNVGADVGSVGIPVPAGTFFNRQSYLSLAANNVGEIRLGRDYVPTWSATVTIDPFGGVGVGAFPNVLLQTASHPLATAFGQASNASSLTWVNNAVQLRSAKYFGGFYANGIAASRENQTTSATGSSLIRGARLGFQNPTVDASYSHVSTDNTLVAGARFNDDVLSGMYDFGVVSLRAIRRTLRIQTDKQVSTMLAATAPVGDFGVFKFSYIRTNQSGANAALNADDATQVAVGYVYNLSKMTALYATAARISNKGQAFFNIPGGMAASAANFGGQRSTGYEFGVRTAF